MRKTVIFGKKNCIEKIDLESVSPIWRSELPVGFTPFAITQYEEYIIVFSTKIFSQKISCFRKNSGTNLWHRDKQHIYEHDPFTPLYMGKHLYYLAKRDTVAKLCCDTGKIIFRKPFNKPLFSSYQMFIANQSLFLFSKKEVLSVDIDTGNISRDDKLTDKFNTKEIKASLGNGSSFLSVIQSAHPSDDGGAGAGAGGGGDGGG